jgi:hypothetical protein
MLESGGRLNQRTQKENICPSSGHLKRVKNSTLIMEAASTSEATVNFYRLHGETTQKTAIFMLATVKTSKL